MACLVPISLLLEASPHRQSKKVPNRFVNVAVEDELQTVFRRWTWPSDPGQNPDNNKEPVPGLRDAFQDAGLASFIAAAEKWCLQMGAAFLNEIVEHWESLIAALGPPGSGGLPDEKCKKLQRALASRRENFGNRTPNKRMRSGAACKEQGPGHAPASAVQVSRALPVVAVASSVVSMAPLSPATSTTADQLATTLYRSWTAPLGGAARDQHVVAGLADALQDAGLSSFLQCIQQWCQQAGVAFLQEVLDEVEDLFETLSRETQSGGLRVHERDKLVAALNVRCARMEELVSAVLLHQGPAQLR